MTKSKVGAEPKGRVKHVITKDAGIHEGIHRDECMENHLIHLPSGRTIEAVGTLDI